MTNDEQFNTRWHNTSRILDGAFNSAEISKAVKVIAHRYYHAHDSEIAVLREQQRALLDALKRLLQEGDHRHMSSWARNELLAALAPYRETAEMFAERLVRESKPPDPDIAKAIEDSFSDIYGEL